MPAFPNWGFPDEVANASFRKVKRKMARRPVNGEISVRIWSTEHLPCLKQLAQSDDSPPTGSHRCLLSRENCYRVPAFARSCWDDFAGCDEVEVSQPVEKL